MVWYASQYHLKVNIHLCVCEWHTGRAAALTGAALWLFGRAMLGIDGCNKIRPGEIHYVTDTAAPGINYTYEISAFDLQYLTKPHLTRKTGSSVMKVRSQTGICEKMTRPSRAAAKTEKAFWHHKYLVKEGDECDSSLREWFDILKTG